MEELKYELLAEVYGRMEAELIKSYLEANGIDVELFKNRSGRTSTQLQSIKWAGCKFSLRKSKWTKPFP